MKWHRGAHVLLAGTVDGEVWMWKIPGGDCKTFQGPGCTASCGILMSDGKEVIVKGCSISEICPPQTC